MLRVLLIVLLMATPFLIYAAFVWMKRRGDAAAAAGQADPLRSLPWVLAAGVACGLAGLVFLKVTSGHLPETKFAPPALVDGVVVPSHPIE